MKSRSFHDQDAYCNGDSDGSPVPWLYLADLYLANGDKDSHARLQELFRKRFNGHLGDSVSEASPAWSSAENRLSLEDYPHVMQEISNLWGRHEVVPFLQGLLVNQRDTPRQGFNLSAYREILMLIELAREREQEFA